MLTSDGLGGQPMSDVAKNNAKHVLMVSIAAAAWFALAVQLPLTIQTSTAHGMNILGAILTYLSFFTLLTNLLVALVLTFSLLATNARWGRFFSSPVVATGTALYIATVGATYFLLLRHTWNPEGLVKLTDFLLHDFVPLGYVAYWIFFVPKSELRWKNTLSWTIYPVTYLAWILIRGDLYGRYPYPFVDVGSLGYPRTLLNSGILLMLFVLVSLAVVALARRKRSRAAGR